MKRLPEEGPIYRRLERALADEIARGRYGAGDFLPTEAELCEEHGVSRHTVRQALRRLQDLGMIERRAGIGTRVVSTRPVNDYQPVAGSPSDIVSLVEGTRIAKVETSEIVADGPLARRLRCRPGSEWFRLQGPRVRRSGPKQPLCWSEQYLRADLDRGRFLRGDIGVEDMAGQRIEQEISAEILDAERASALEVAVGSAALVVTRRHYDGRRLASVGIHTHPADRFTIRSVIEPDSLSPGAPAT